MLPQSLFKVVPLTRTVMLSKAKHLPSGVRGRLFAGAQSDNEKALMLPVGMRLFGVRLREAVVDDVPTSIRCRRAAGVLSISDGIPSSFRRRACAGLDPGPESSQARHSSKGRTSQRKQRLWPRWHRGTQGTSPSWHALPLSPNPPMDRDGRREDSGRGMRELQER